jgi:hypothetical protein
MQCPILGETLRAAVRQTSTARLTATRLRVRRTLRWSAAAEAAFKGASRSRLHKKAFVEGLKRRGIEAARLR